MNKEYFNNNVMMAIEVETECGGRYWDTMLGSEVDAFCKRHENEISDIDYCCNQPDAFCRKVLNLAELNFFKNRAYCEKHNITSFFKMIDFILDNGLAD